MRANSLTAAISERISLNELEDRTGKYGIFVGKKIDSIFSPWSHKLSVVPDFHNTVFAFFSTAFKQHEVFTSFFLRTLWWNTEAKFCVRFFDTEELLVSWFPCSLRNMKYDSNIKYNWEKSQQSGKISSMCLL